MVVVLPNGVYTMGIGNYPIRNTLLNIPIKPLMGDRSIMSHILHKSLYGIMIPSVISYIYCNMTKILYLYD